MANQLLKGAEKKLVKSIYFVRPPHDELSLSNMVSRCFKPLSKQGMNNKYTCSVYVNAVTTTLFGSSVLYL